MRYLIIICCFLISFTGVAYGYMTEFEAHDKYIYPVVRVSGSGGSGSGTIIYSALNGKSYSTYVLTNHHVIASAIDIRDEWDPGLKKEVKREKRQTVYVEIFKYRDLSTPIGTLKVEADIVIYTKAEDVALLKLRTEDKAVHVASLYPRGEFDTVYVMDETVAVGCSLSFPPLPTAGHLTRKNFQLDSYNYHMSSSQIIYGNSGGAMFLAETGEFIGIPSRVAVAGWYTVIPHMGLFIPIERIYNFLEREHYEFLFDSAKTEATCMEEREEDIKKRKDAE